jgi:DNA helicase MCM8
MEDGLVIGAPNVDLESHDASSKSQGIKSGRMPRLLDCELSGELVEQLNPGDVVIMSGIIRSRRVDQTARGRNTAELSLFLDVNYTCTTHSAKQSKLIKQPQATMDEFSSSDLSRIASLITSQTRYALFPHMVQSLCPAIMGHEFVKAGLLLCLMGGSISVAKEWRSNLHILVVGDPGLGKSQLLRAVSRVSPRGVFVCGNLATKSGLTVTMSKDPNSNEHSLEAGALLLANDGACCIDELDKMSSEHPALLEAMEQQRVSVAKAGW